MPRERVMPLCPSCEHQAGENDVFCPKCGAALGQTGQAGQTGHNSDSAAPPPPPPPPQPAQAAGQEISEAEWRAYLGKNADYYLGQFPRFKVGGVEGFAATWNWAAFLATFWWFLYRKQYLFFGLALVGMFLPYVKWFVWIACGLTANYLYHAEARRHILSFKANNPGRDVTAMLAQAGGVHAWVPPVAVAVSVLLFLAMFIMMALVGGMFMGYMFKSMGGSQSF
jgi:hypothetical protein